jgi:hypothetical protein
LVLSKGLCPATAVRLRRGVLRRFRLTEPNEIR